MSHWSALARLGPYTVAALIWRAKQCCTWCGVRVCRGAYGIDHLIPRALGGPDVHTNLVLACTDCNSARGDDPGISPALRVRLDAAGRTEADCWAEVERQTAIPVGRGTWANLCARPLARRWFGKAIDKDLAHARAYKARAAQEATKPT